MLSNILLCVLFYLIGSFPTAFILLKLKYKKNILKEGTGNVGARNTFDVTNSKVDGIIVLVVDFLKGLIPVLLLLNAELIQPQYVLLPALFLLIGHNYSVWLKFKGGRGLATAAGIMVAVNFTLVIIWLVFYFVLSKLVKNVHVAASMALILLPLTVMFLGGLLVSFNNHVIAGTEDPMRILFAFCSSICIIILLKHINPVLEVIRSKKIS